jgi:2'-5' RNA ligase
MRYGVFFTFDDKTQTALQGLRERMVREVKGLPRVAGKMGPHLTLAVFDDNDHERVLEHFQKLAESLRPFNLTIHDIGFFPGRRKVIFAAPLPSPELQLCYECCHAAFKNAAMVPDYRDSEKWHAHITLAKGISGRVFHNAKSCAETNWTPMNAAVQKIGIVNVQKPLEVLGERKL